MQQKTIKIPKEMLDEIEKHIEKNPALGYTSTADFIRGLIRKAMEEEEKTKRK